MFKQKVHSCSVLLKRKITLQYHEHSIDYRTGAVAPSIACPPHMQTDPKLTLASGTLFRRNPLPLSLFQEDQVVSYWRMTGH